MTKKSFLLQDTIQNTVTLVYNKYFSVSSVFEKADKIECYEIFYTNMTETDHC